MDGTVGNALQLEQVWLSRHLYQLIPLCLGKIVENQYLT